VVDRSTPAALKFVFMIRTHHPDRRWGSAPGRSPVL